MERFRFNPEILTYQKIELSQRQKLFRFLAFMGLALFIAVVILLFRDQFLQSYRAENLTTSQQQITYELGLMNRDLSKYENNLTEVAFNDDHIYRVYFGVEPWSSSIRSAGVGGSRKYDWLQQYKYADLLRQTYMNIDQVILVTEKS